MVVNLSPFFSYLKCHKTHILCKYIIWDRIHKIMGVKCNGLSPFWLPVQNKLWHPQRSWRIWPDCESQQPVKRYFKKISINSEIEVNSRNRRFQVQVLTSLSISRALSMRFKHSDLNVCNQKANASRNQSWYCWIVSRNTSLKHWQKQWLIRMNYQSKLISELLTIAMTTYSERIWWVM